MQRGLCRSREKHWKNFGVLEPVAVNVTGDEARLVTLKFCGLSVALGRPVKINPVGATTGSAGVPAGTMWSTIAIETGGCTPSAGVRVTEP